MAIQHLLEHISELQNNVQAYVKSTLDYYKLLAFKNATKSAAIFVKLMVFGSFFLFFLFFLSFAFAYLIGVALGNLSYGFFIIAGVYFVVFIILLTFSKTLFDKIILREASKIVFKEDEESEEEGNNENPKIENKREEL
ncbi:hypothetical protein [Mesonia sp. K7]|uniref:hypothetical protein n=1 Tax=Mesonia sp. K7 TaxID=2218606 RepID=UPI000DA8A8C5|nr:hypothetical protein [Mesonia sp. K7]PZD79136.1 hypothetical protein DNG35_03765 [Mesonia sp. K7]